MVTFFAGCTKISDPSETNKTNGSTNQQNANNQPLQNTKPSQEQAKPQGIVTFKETKWLGLDKDIMGRFSKAIDLPDGKKDAHIKLKFDVSESIVIDRIVFTCNYFDQRFNWYYGSNAIYFESTVYKVKCNILSIPDEGLKLGDVLDPPQATGVIRYRLDKGSYDYDMYLDIYYKGFDKVYQQADNIKVDFEVITASGEQKTFSTVVKLK